MSNSKPESSALKAFDNNADIILFVGMALLIFGALQFVYYFLYLGSPAFKAYLVLCAKLSTGILLAIGEEVHRYEQTITSMQGPSVTVVEGCDALRIFSVLIAAIFAFHANFKDKILGVTFGLTLMFFANLLRISSLLWFDVHYPELFDLMHYTMLPLMLWFIAMLFFFFWGKTVMEKMPATQAAPS